MSFAMDSHVVRLIGKLINIGDLCDKLLLVGLSNEVNLASERLFE